MYLIFRMEETVALLSGHIIIAVFNISALNHHVTLRSNRTKALFSLLSTSVQDSVSYLSYLISQL